jgi:hypothetical protein
MSSLEDCNKALEIVSDIMINTSIDCYSVDTEGLIGTGVITVNPQNSEAYKLEVEYEKLELVYVPCSIPIIFRELAKQGLAHVSLEFQYLPDSHSS